MNGILLIALCLCPPMYLIHLLIHHPRTSSKKGLCGLCVETDTKTEQGTETSKNKITKLFNTAKN